MVEDVVEMIVALEMSVLVEAVVVVDGHQAAAAVAEEDTGTLKETRKRDLRKCPPRVSKHR